MASDPWIMPQGWTRSQNLGHLKISFSFYRIIRIEQLVLLRADFLSVNLDLGVYDPG